MGGGAVSRLVGRPVTVTCDGDDKPLSLLLPGARRPLSVRRVVAHWREWIGVLDGEPERDVWQVETLRGICELHCLRYPVGEEAVQGSEFRVQGSGNNR